LRLDDIPLFTVPNRERRPLQLTESASFAGLRDACRGESLVAGRGAFVDCKEASSGRDERVRRVGELVARFSYH
jgi:hypothetical protein